MMNFAALLFALSIRRLFCCAIPVSCSCLCQRVQVRWRSKQTIIAKCIKQKEVWSDLVCLRSVLCSVAGSAARQSASVVEQQITFCGPSRGFFPRGEVRTVPENVLTLQISISALQANPYTGTSIHLSFEKHSRNHRTPSISQKKDKSAANPHSFGVRVVRCRADRNL